jgi:hypothetical protein
MAKVPRSLRSVGICLRRAHMGGHKKIILYASPGTEAFYDGLGFLPMKTAMGLWSDPGRAIEIGLLNGERSQL